MFCVDGYDILGNGSVGLRYAWRCGRFSNYVESASFFNRTKTKQENICGYTTSVSMGCVLKAQGLQCSFCRTGNTIPFGGFLTYKEIAKQNIFMVLSDMYCVNHPELATKQREFAYMGQGEPGFSYPQVRLAIELTNAVMHELKQVVFRHVFATCGIPEAIKAYTFDLEHYFTEKVTLHLSLHATEARNHLMPINTVYPYTDFLKEADRVVEINGEKPCIGIMLFNQFIPQGRHWSYSNTLNRVQTIIKDLDPKKYRLSFCEFNNSVEIGKAEFFSEEIAADILRMALEMGFEAKLFFSYGADKQTACGMLGSRVPENAITANWRELDLYADDLIKKHL